MATHCHWLQLLLFVLVINHNRICESVTCSKTGDCQCTRNEPCQLNCIGKDYCKGGVTLKCRASQPCSLICSGEQACTDSTLVPNGASSVSITCSGGKACSGAAEFECAADAPCSLACPLGNCDDLSVAVDGASSYKCVGSGCPSAPAPYASPSPTPSPTKQPTTPAPTGKPTQKPSATPSRAPSTGAPSRAPSKHPSNIPSRLPSYSPSRSPSTVPTRSPSRLPTQSPSNGPSNEPTPAPTAHPSLDPTQNPSAAPSSNPSSRPTSVPTRAPSDVPSRSPSSQPSSSPSSRPTPTPSKVPTWAATNHPSNGPTPYPSTVPTSQPSSSPTFVPSASPSKMPTRAPTNPSSAPSATPSSQPSRSPTASTRAPTTRPTSQPTPRPTHNPTHDPSSFPSPQPTASPSVRPTAQPTPRPTASPSQAPTASGHPSKSPTANTAQPTSSPSDVPTRAPSTNPSASPSGEPSSSPTRAPSNNPSATPSGSPSIAPSAPPSNVPSVSPTRSLSASPTMKPTDLPSTKSTSMKPSRAPSDAPSSRPTHSPSAKPTLRPSDVPTRSPITSQAPTSSPSDSPTVHATGDHSSSPTIRPSMGSPSVAPSARPTAEIIVISEVHSSTHRPDLDLPVPHSDNDDDVSDAQIAVLSIAGLSLFCVFITCCAVIVPSCGWYTTKKVVKLDADGAPVDSDDDDDEDEDRVLVVVAVKPRLRFSMLFFFAGVCSAFTFALSICFIVNQMAEQLLTASSISYASLKFCSTVYFILRLHSAFRNTNKIFAKGGFSCSADCDCFSNKCTVSYMKRLTAFQILALICLSALAMAAFTMDIMDVLGLLRSTDAVKWALSPVNHIVLLVCFLIQLCGTRDRKNSLISVDQSRLLPDRTFIKKRVAKKAIAREFVVKVTVLSVISWVNSEGVSIAAFFIDDVFVSAALQCYGALVMILCMIFAFEFAGSCFKYSCCNSLSESWYCLRWCCSSHTYVDCKTGSGEKKKKKKKKTKKKQNKESALSCMEMSPRESARPEQEKAFQEMLCNRGKRGTDYYGAQWLKDKKTTDTAPHGPTSACQSRSSSTASESFEQSHGGAISAHDSDSDEMETKLDMADTSGRDNVYLYARGVGGGRSLRRGDEYDFGPESHAEHQFSDTSVSLQDSVGSGMPKPVRSRFDVFAQASLEHSSLDI